MTRDHLQDYVDRLLKGEITPEQITNRRLFHLVLVCAYTRNELALVKRMASVANRRIIARGYVRLPGMGWYRKTDIERAGIRKHRSGSYVIGNVHKYRAYIQAVRDAEYAKKTTKQVTLED